MSEREKPRTQSDVLHEKALLTADTARKIADVALESIDSIVGIAPGPQSELMPRRLPTRADTAAMLLRLDSIAS